jgi:hypothetical protein
MATNRPRRSSPKPSQSSGVVGTVHGQVLQEQRKSRFWGWKLLLLLALIFLVLLILTGRDVIELEVAQGMGGFVVSIVLFCMIGAAVGLRNATDSLTVRRFRVIDLLGHTNSCVMLGELSGDIMRPGDLVRVHGRPTRAGVINARRVDILEKADLPPRSMVRRRMRGQFLAAQALDIACKLASLCLVTSLVVALIEGAP